ncbi:helix-turn-helix transcriptional regulator [Pseudomonas sp. TH05]|uniref:helix-turn-helix transcriptional regulator n=1 Tax=unclassified Pseudomonas TaxID=196821 RepID=UPI0019122594|nr:MULTISPECIES: helix-turn-helix transcriptional regulator [unclassified Pseudomonas]MBK5540911.1 helix-turn-helix transcriptional regulator [Pseudomonas sp. TH07]MBK5556213.1 helix-turn-helix transcriptional regulator [Pseudomonas sp. TH05]
MSLTSSIGTIESPPFYFELGELISSTGNDRFAANMLHLVEKRVPVTRVELSEWTLDEELASLLDIKPLGSATLREDSPCPASWQRNAQPLLEKMLEMDDALLIQVNARAGDPASRHTVRETSHQCSLVSRTSNRRCVISFYRPRHQGVFSLSELSFLKSLSQTLLPLIERHAQANRNAALGQAWAGGLPALPEQALLQREFDERLSRNDITLSAREKEVCLGLLSGGTVPQLAEKLSLKNSSIETYLKRAAAKLGVSGRHGLAKWMVGA